MPTQTGTDQDETLTGTSGDDVIYGNGGDDEIWGYSGTDVIYGGDGDDVLHAGYDGWQDVVMGEDGNDRVIHLGRGDLFHGGNGEDTAVFARDSKNYAISVYPASVINTDGFVMVLSFLGAPTRLWSTELFEFRDGTFPIADFMFTGYYTPAASTSVSTVYRFYNTRDKAFFYTSNVDERDYVILNSAPKYTSGTGGYLEETAPYHRYFSYTEGWRSQFYTDRQYDLDNNPDYIYEGIFQVPVKADDDVFKELEGLLNDDELIPLFIPDSAGGDSSWPYIYQGSTFETGHTYLDSDKLAPVHRFYNYETGHHFFTLSDAEADMIKGKSASGEWPFNYEGTRFSVYSADPTPGYLGQEIAVHRFYSPTLNRHFFSADAEEVNLIGLTGVWNYEGIAFWGEILG